MATQSRSSSTNSGASVHLRRYREPLVLAAYQLRNRIENITDGAFLQRYVDSHREYVVNSTVYAFAELLAWIELFHQDSQLLDLGGATATRDAGKLLVRTGRVLATDTIVDPDGKASAFMIWRLEQRAIGDLMIERTDRGAYCMGYAAFTASLADPAFSRWFVGLSSDVARVAAAPACGRSRLIKIAEEMTAIIEHLDPEQVVVPFRSGRPPIDGPPRRSA